MTIDGEAVIDETVDNTKEGKKALAIRLTGMIVGAVAVGVVVYLINKHDTTPLED